MKIRLDFVSNSSSSSFMLVGQAFDGNELVEAWKRLHPDEAKTTTDEFDYYDLADNIAGELSLSLARGLDHYYDQWVLGLSFDKMKDNETKKQFMQRIQASLEKAFNDVHVSVCSDSGYDG